MPTGTAPRWSTGRKPFEGSSFRMGRGARGAGLEALGVGLPLLRLLLPGGEEVQDLEPVPEHRLVPLLGRTGAHVDLVGLLGTEVGDDRERGELGLGLEGGARGRVPIGLGLGDLDLLGVELGADLATTLASGLELGGLLGVRLLIDLARLGGGLAPLLLVGLALLGVEPLGEIDDGAGGGGRQLEIGRNPTNLEHTLDPILDLLRFRGEIDGLGLHEGDDLDLLGPAGQI